MFKFDGHLQLQFCLAVLLSSFDCGWPYLQRPVSISCAGFTIPIFTEANLGPMEGMDVVESMVQFQFQGSSVLNKEFINNPAMSAFQAMMASGQLPEASELLDDNFVNCSEFLSTHQPTPYGYFSLLNSASATLDKEASNKKLVEFGRQEPLPLVGETDFSFWNSLLLNHYKNVCGLEPLEVPPFAASKKKLILFAKSGENKRVLLRPYAVCDDSTLTAKDPDEIGRCIKLYCQTIFPLLKKQGEKIIVPVAGMPSMYRQTIPSSAFAVFDSIGCSRASSLSICNMDDVLQDGAFEFDCASQGSCRESNHRGVREVSGSLHEDTWELEALMSSDEDEMSTGHSPSDVTWNDILTNGGGTFSIAEKRKACENECNKEVECDSSCQEVESVFRDDQCFQCFDLSVMNDGTYQNIVSSTFESVMGPTELDSLSGLRLCTPLKNSNARMRQAFASLSRQSTSRKRPKKDKIRRTMELLRSVVPGGNSMSTADVLGEAIQYVRTLQLKVSKLEQSREQGSEDAIVGVESSLHIAKRNRITSC